METIKSILKVIGGLAVIFICIAVALGIIVGCIGLLYNGWLAVFCLLNITWFEILKYMLIVTGALTLVMFTIIVASAIVARRKSSQV